MAAEEASFNTDTLSISAGLSKLRSLNTTLSTKISGAPPVMDSNPRIFHLFSPPGAAEVEAVKPGIAPCKAEPRPVTGLSPKTLSICTDPTAPVRFAFFCVPKPTTTTSSKL